MMPQDNNSKQDVDVLVVGAGFAGSVVARELADAGRRVLVIDKRSHIGGNAYDSYDEHGVLIHNYGPHIFHTNNEEVFRWLSRFTDWRFYEHRVLAKVGEQLLPIPINRTTINKLYDLDLDEEGIAAYLEKNRVPRDPVKTSEDVVLNSVGNDLCEKFFRGYTRKQWGLDLSELNAGVAARIPTRSNDDDRYFTDTYQFMPLEGYTVMFQRILEHENITVQLGVDFSDVRKEIQANIIIYTGQIDEYYEYRFGKLPYRSLIYDHYYLTDIEQKQLVGTINYPNDYAYTRTTEFKHLTGQKTSGTSFVSEYPQTEGEPYYPIPREGNELLYSKYKELAVAEKSVDFVGRLAQYRYYNMDQVVYDALLMSKKYICI